MSTEIFRHSNLVLLYNKQAKTNISGIGTNIVGRNFTLVIIFSFKLKNCSVLIEWRTVTLWLM